MTSFQDALRDEVAKKGGGNPHHGKDGKFTSGPGGGKPRAPDDLPVSYSSSRPPKPNKSVGTKGISALSAKDVESNRRAAERATMSSEDKKFSSAATRLAIALGKDKDLGIDGRGLNEIMGGLQEAFDAGELRQELETGDRIGFSLLHDDVSPRIKSYARKLARVEGRGTGKARMYGPKRFAYEDDE